jgi:3-isopropylmalate/(R)-2-methylmalate dehydratase small subunit
LEKLSVKDNQGFEATFQIEESTRHRLLNGLDDIGLSLQHESEIAAYEAAHPAPAITAKSI